MKILEKTKILITLTAMLLGLCFSSFAQNGPTKDRWQVKVGGQLLHSRFLSSVHNPGIWDDIQFRTELNYGFSKAIEAGLYIGHIFPYQMEIIDSSTSNNITTITYNYTNERDYGLAYGVSINFHLFPIFIKKNNFRFDLYTSVNIGRNALFMNGEGSFNNVRALYRSQEMIILGGFSCFITKHVAINTEVNFRKDFNEFRHLRLSLVYKI